MSEIKVKIYDVGQDKVGFFKMNSLTAKIMRRIRGHGRGTWVCTPKDFLDLGCRAAIDQALSRLVRKEQLRRIGRGLYDLPRISGILNRPAPSNIDAAVKAVGRRDHLSVMPDGIVAANQLGLTNAVPAQIAYITDGTTRTLKIGARTVHLKYARKSIMQWAGRPGVQVVQALAWLGKAAASDPAVTDLLKSRLPDVVKQDLLMGIGILPAWMAAIVRNITPDLSSAA
jgi:hypothetical protein